MSLPGLLVEYLINGCIALIWLFGLNLFTIIEQLREGEKLILIPVAYVLGMFIDIVAWTITYPIKQKVRKHSLKVIVDEMKISGRNADIGGLGLYWNERVEIEKSYPGLNNELQSRSSRDRIARGTFINLIPISIIYWEYLHWFGIGILVVSALMWIKFEHYNHCFEIRAAVLVREELQKKKLKNKEVSPSSKCMLLYI